MKKGRFYIGKDLKAAADFAFTHGFRYYLLSVSDSPMLFIYDVTEIHSHGHRPVGDMVFSGGVFDIVKYCNRLRSSEVCMLHQEVNSDIYSFTDVI